MMGSGPSTSATSSWRASMNATTSSAREYAAEADFEGYHRMATLIIVALRGGTRCVITPFAPPKHSGQHRLQFQQMLPMFPVNSVTYLPGCSTVAAGASLESVHDL